jgi:hypothetical protein
VKLKITLLILGGLAWAYVLSAVYAIGLWTKIFESVTEKFDLTYAQGILLTPGISITLCILTGIASVFWVIKNIRTGKMLSASFENLAGFFCLSAFLFYAHFNIVSASTFAQMMSNVQTERTHRAIYEAGQVRNGYYENNSYGFSCQVPAGWKRASWGTFERKKIRAAFSLFSLWGKNTSLTNWVPAHTDGIDTLAAILKHLPDTESYNPSLVINANDKRLMFGKYGISNLMGFAEMLTKVPQPFVVEQPPVPVNISNRTVIKIIIISMRNGYSINQTIFAFEAENSYLEFVASAIDGDDSSNLVTCVKTVTFTK